MIRQGGVFDKIGNWYEQSLVMLQWLRLLQGDIERVCWEPQWLRGEGVDYHVYESGERVAVQCKTRSGAWRPSDLRESLAYARRRLDTDAVRYRFISNSNPWTLDAAIQSANRRLAPAPWLAAKPVDRSKFVDFLGFDHEDPQQLAVAVELFKRIEVVFTGQSSLNERILEFAKALAGDRAENLLGNLYRLSQPESLGREWTQADLFDELRRRDFDIDPASRIARSANWMEQRADEFLAGIEHARRCLREVPRAEAERLRQLVAKHTPIVLVHGRQGSGKSNVLAQAVRALRDEGVRVLAMRADDIYDPSDPEIGKDPIGTFRRLLGDRNGCVVIDQLDQAAATSTVTVRSILRMVRSALREGITVVVGCRSVDANQETGIHQVLYCAGTQPTEVAIGDFDESVVAAILAERGIPLGDLAAEMIAILRVPLWLKLFLDVFDASGSRPGQPSAILLLIEWCRTLAKIYGESFEPLLDEIARWMEEDRVSAVGRSRLQGKYSELVDRLRADSILIDVGGDKVRPFHQSISDTRLAIQWGNLSSTGEFLARLGPRRAQGLRDARRARLVVPLLAERGQNGSAILDGLAWDDTLRPTVRRSLLLGIADLTEIPPVFVDLVKSWMSHEERRAVVLMTVIRSQAEWVDALGDWFDDAWHSWSEPQRTWLLDALASVSTQRPDVVARHLARWERDAPGTIARAERIFWHDPSTDSEELFRLRLDYLASAEVRDIPYEWPELMAQHPLRAARLAALLLAKTQTRQWEEPDWLYGFPSVDLIPAPMLEEGSAVFDEFLPAWSTIELDGAWQWRRAQARIVALLGRCLASAISRGDLRWQDVVARLPDPPRTVDNVLLLYVGSYLNLDEAPPEASAAAAEWIQSDATRLRTLMEGFADLVAGFLKTISARLDASLYGELEEWLVRYPDTWTVTDEEARHAVYRRDGRFRPTRRGETAFRLLPCLDRSRWSAATRDFFEILERKFGDWTPFVAESELRGGWIRSKIPDSAAARFSASQWVDAIERAPVFDPDREQIDSDHLGDSSNDALIAQLRTLAEEDPRKYVPVAEAIAREPDRVPTAVFPAILGALGRTKPPERSAAAWSPLLDPEFERIVVAPAYLQCDEAARDLGWSICGRAEHPWPSVVVVRLIEIARGGSLPSTEASNGERIELQRLNDDACVALRALAALCLHHGGLHAELLGIAEELLAHRDAGRRASAAMLAWECRGYDSGRAARAVLAAARDSNIAAQRDVHRVLRWLVRSTDSNADIRAEAHRRMFSLIEYSDAPRAEWGGLGLLCLRAWDMLEPAVLVERLAENVIARRSAARVLAEWLREPDAQPWMLELARALAEDADEQVGNSIVMLFQGSQETGLLDNDEFVSSVVRSAAGRRKPGPLIRACDKHGSLLRVADSILALAAATVAPSTESDDPGLFGFHAEQVTSLLVRLNQEAEQSQNGEVARLSLDALDRIIEANRIGPGRAWKLLASASEA